MEATGSISRIGFHRSQLILWLTTFVIGGAFIWYSATTHSAKLARIAVLDTKKPMNVLVAVQGTPLNPGFVGFVAEVRPRTQILGVVPISGRTQVVVDKSKEPLYSAVSDASPRQAMHLVSKATGLPIDHYFYLNQASLIKLVDALYYHSPHWPKRRTPLTMLTTLGYPSGRIQPHREMTLLRQMVNRVPTISPIAASSLLSIPRTSLTNLSKYQLFLLANYVRGDQLVQQSLPHPHSKGRSHG